MQSTFHEPTPGEAVIQNATGRGTEQLKFTMQGGNDGFPLDVALVEDTTGTSTMSISREGVAALVKWFKEQCLV